MKMFDLFFVFFGGGQKRKKKKNEGNNNKNWENLEKPPSEQPSTIPGLNRFLNWTINDSAHILSFSCEIFPGRKINKIGTKISNRKLAPKIFIRVDFFK